MRTRVPAIASPTFSDTRLIELLKPLTRSKCRVTVFVGNGINEESPLSTKAIVGGFVEKSASANPRDHEEKHEALQRLERAIASTGLPPDMTKFMRDFEDVGEIRDRFVSYVIETCCKARPAENHLLVALLCTLLAKYGKGMHSLCVFTTNYDNLLERVVDDIGGYGPRVRIRAHHALGRGYSHSVATRAAQILLRARYCLDSKSTRGKYPVVPLHGSIRVCRCPGCGRRLSSEAAAVEHKRCVFCGSEVPRVVVPTTEGETDKLVLALLEEWISMSAVVAFVGYGFGDPHIIERLKRGFAANTRAKDMAIINYCHAPFPREKMGSLQLPDPLNLESDVTESLAQTSRCIGSQMEPAVAELTTQLSSTFIPIHVSGPPPNQAATSRMRRARK